MLELPVAGPTSRILAYAVDALLIALLVAGLVLLLFTLAPVAEWLVRVIDAAGDELVGEDGGPPSLGSHGFLLVALLIGGQLLLELFYFVFFETVWRGRSPGKRLLGLGVANEDGLPVRFGASLVRNLLRSVDVLPMYYTTGLVTMLVSDRSRRLGDIAAGTLVIRYDRPGAAAPLPAEDGDAPHVPFTRDQLGRAGAMERRLLRQTLRRVDGLPPDAAEALAQRSARALAERLDADGPEPGAARSWLHALHARLSRR